MLPTQNDEMENEAEAPRSGGASRLIVWLIVFSLAILFLTLNLISTTLREGRAPLSTEVAGLQATLSSTPPPNPTEVALSEALSQTRAQLNAIDAASQDLINRHIDWPEALAIIANYDSSQMQLISLSQTDNTLLISGRAMDELVVFAYAERLRQSDRFVNVTIQAITSLSLPTPTPTQTPSPTPRPDDAPTETNPVTSTPSPLPTPQRVAEFTIIIAVKTGPAATPEA